MTQTLANHLLQSTIFAVVAGMLTLLLRKNHARTRYWVWLAASMKFLVPFSLFVEIGNRLSWSHAPIVVRPGVALVVDAVSQPFMVPETFAVAPAGAAGAPSSFPMLLLGAWVCGCAVVLIFWFVRWQRVSAGMRAGVPIRGGREIVALHRLGGNIELIASPSQVEPGVFGILTPVLSLPTGIASHLDDQQLEAILAHELCHVRYRDNLTAALHMLVEAVCWFHPLVWFIGARLVEERERACDEEVVRLGIDPDAYASGILNVCKLYLGSPLACVSGVTGSDLRNRIEEIMGNRVARTLNPARKLALAVVGIMAVGLPVGVGIMHAPGALAQSITSAASISKFEVASIRPGCSSGAFAQTKSAGRGGGRGSSLAVGGRLNDCHTLADFIHMAYVMYAGGQFHGVWGPQFAAGPPIQGGPAWIHSDAYQINAKAVGTPGRDTMSGPMLQSLLEDRFRLKIHRESKGVPVYALTVAKGGPKLQAFREGSCVPMPPLPPGEMRAPLPPGQKFCAVMLGFRKGPNTGMDTHGISLQEFSDLLVHLVDRPVINKTGVQGKFDIRLDFAIDEATPRFMPGGDMADLPSLPSDQPPAPSIFTAIEEQLGLKLESATGSGEYFVIDHVERPTAN